MKPTRINRFAALPSLILLLVGAQSTQAVDFNWDPGLTGGTTGSGSGTWNTALPNSWWNGTASSTFTSANTSKAIFGGADGTYAVTVAGPLTISDVTFSNSGYTLSAATTQAITAGAGTSTTTIASGKSATIGSNIVRSRYVTSAAQTNSSDVIAGGGTLNVGVSGGSSTNAQFVNAAVGSTGSRIMTITAGTTVNVNSGGFYGVSSTAAYTPGTPTNSGNPNGSTLGVGIDSAGGTLVVKAGGTVTAGNNTHVVVGLGTASTGTVTIDGGQVNGGAITLTTGGIFPTSTLYGGMRFGSNNSTSGTRIANLNGGTLTVGQIFVSGTTGTSTNTFNFNGGTLQATISNATFMTGLTSAVVKSGNAIIDSNGFDITIGQALVAGSPSGGLTKSSLGTLTLSGASTYTGATAVNAGGLNVTGTLASAVTVANNATLSGSGSTTGSLTLNTGSTIVGAAIGSSFSASTVAPTGAAGVIIAGNNGSTTPGLQTMGVVRYSTGAGPTLANFSTAGYHAGATLANVGGAGGETQLTYTNVGRTWNSAAGNWDLMTSTTWQEGDFKFGQGDVVTFDDTGTGGGSSRAVTLSSSVSPASVTFNNSTTTPYTVSGTGAIGGATGLAKTGSGSVVVSTSNTYTGTSRVNEGTLSINTLKDTGLASALGAPMTNGLIVLGNVDKPGTLIYTGAVTGSNRTIRVGTNSIPSAVTDTGGAVIQNDGSGPVSFSATSFNSALNVSSGVGANRILTLQGSNTGFNTVSGIIRDNTVTSPATGTATVGITKAGTGNWALAGINTYTGPTTVTDGTLLINNAPTTSSPVSVNGGTLGGTGTIKGNVTVGAAGSIAPGITAGTLTITGALDITALAAAGTGKLVFDLAALAGTSDKIAITGTGTLNIGTGVLGFSDFAFSNLGGLEVGTYKLITNANPVTGTLDPIPANLTGPIGAFTGTVQFNGGDLELVVAASVVQNYATWANDPLKGNIPSEPATGDFDNDGITNIVEYALGKNPRVSSQPAGVLSGNVITYTKGVDAIANGDVSWVIETSQTLAAGSWTPQPDPSPSATISFTFTPGSPVKNFARLKVTQVP